MRNQRLTLDMPQRVFQLHQLNKEIVLRIKPGSRHRRLPVKAQPLLNPNVLQLRSARSQIQEEDEIQSDGRGQDRIPAQKINLDLHRIAKPTEDVNVVPTLFVIT